MSNSKIDALSPAALDCLLVCWDAALDAAGGDFGFSGEAWTIWKGRHPQGTQQQFAGLYGALVSALVLYSDDEAEVNGKLLGESQFDFPDDVRDYLWEAVA